MSRGGWYFDQLAGAHARALAAADDCPVFHAKIAGVAIVLRFAGRELAEAVMPSIRHLASEPTDKADLDIGLFDARPTGVAVPEPDWSVARHTKHAEIEGHCDARFACFLEEAFATVSTLDRETGQAYYAVADAASLPYYERAAPLRAILNAFFNTRGLQIAHGSAVGTDEGAVVLTGKAGSGKSTTALLCVMAGMRYLADDWCLVACDGTPAVHSLYQTAKIRPENLHRFTTLHDMIRNHDKLDEEKATLLVGERFGARLVGSLPVRAVLLPRVSGKADTELSAASRGECWHALVPSTLAWMPGAGTVSFGLLSRFVQSTNAHRLDLGTDLVQIPALIRDFLSRP